MLQKVSISLALDMHQKADWAVINKRLMAGREHMVCFPGDELQAQANDGGRFAMRSPCSNGCQSGIRTS
jgi:hypothetical protein